MIRHNVGQCREKNYNYVRTRRRVSTGRGVVRTVSLLLERGRGFEGDNNYLPLVGKQGALTGVLAPSSFYGNRMVKGLWPLFSLPLPLNFYFSHSLRRSKGKSSRVNLHWTAR